MLIYYYYIKEINNSLVINIYIFLLNSVVYHTFHLSIIFIFFILHSVKNIFISSTKINKFFEKYNFNPLQNLF